MDRRPDVIPLAYEKPAISARLRTRLVALVLLWAAAAVTVWFWL